MKKLLIVVLLLAVTPVFAQSRKEKRLQRKDAKVTFVREQRKVHRKNFPNPKDTKVYRGICVGGFQLFITLNQFKTQ